MYCDRRGKIQSSRYGLNKGLNEHVEDILFMQTKFRKNEQTSMHRKVKTKEGIKANLQVLKKHDLHKKIKTKYIHKNVSVILSTLLYIYSSQMCRFLWIT